MICFFIRKESAGVPENLHKIIKYKIKIPMNQKTRSLNVVISVVIVDLRHSGKINYSNDTN